MDEFKMLFRSFDKGDYQSVECVEFFDNSTAHFCISVIIRFSFAFAFLSESFFGLAVFFLMAILPLLQTVVARFQKHFIDFVSVDFDPDVAIGSGSRFAFQNQKTVLDFV